jgi:precorrin-6Y C5,15-methyltransferase (decarboxylating)
VNSKPQIYVIGVDDSGPACLTAAELGLIQRADLLCGGARQLALFPQIGQQRLAIAGDLDSFYEQLAAWRGGSIAVLASGDPCFFGIGPLLVDRFGIDRVRINPRPSAVAVAFARLGMAWQDATVVTVHGRPVGDAIPPIKRATKVAILTDPEHTPACVASALLAAAMEDCPAYVCERLGGPREMIHELRLADLPERQFDSVNVLILLPNHSPDAPQGFGQPDSDYQCVRGQITKAEVRSIALARLEPWRAATCWDVGAGCGSVSIESARLMPVPRVFAVERDQEQLAALHHNIARHQALGVHVIKGSAPDILGPLPPPDAVFVGGSGGELAKVLDVACRRLKPGGRLAANFALIESLSEWRTIAAATGWTAEITEVNVSRSEPLGAGTRLAPLGPVFVTRLLKPEARP